MMAHRACDVPSCRVVTKFRESVLAKMLVTVRRVYDGPCCTSVAKFRELIPRTQISEFKYFGTKTLDGRRDHDGPSCDPSTLSVIIKSNSTTRND